jgi:chromosome segregation ATPase
MSHEHENTIKELRENLDKAKNMKFRAEARLEQLEKQKQDIINEINAMGLKPENLESEITKLEGQIEQLLNEAKKMVLI